MTVIAEYVLIDNFALDYMLAYITLSVFNLPKKRAVGSALAGTACAFIYPLIPSYLLIPYTIITLMLCVIPLLGFVKISRMLKVTLLYCMISCGFCGIITLMLNSSFTIGVYYSNGGKLAIICFGGLLSFILTLKVINVISSKPCKEKYVKIAIQNENLHEGKGFIDEGNLALGSDGCGVVFLGKKFSSFFSHEPVGDYIYVNTVNGASIREIIKIPELRIYSNGTEHIYKNVNAVKTSENYEGFDVLLSSKIKENM